MRVTISQEFDLVREAAQLLAFKAMPDSRRFASVTFDEAAGRTPRRELLEAAQTLDAMVSALFDRLALTEEEIALFTPDLTFSDQAEDENSLLCPFKCGSALGFDEIVRRVKAMDEPDIRAFLIAETMPLENEASPQALWENRDARVFTRGVLANPDLKSEQKCHLLQICTDYHAYFDRAAALVARCVDALAPLLPQLAPLLSVYAQSLAQNAPDTCPDLLASVAQIVSNADALVIYPQLAWPRALTLRLRRPSADLPTPVDAFIPEIRGAQAYVGLYIPYVPDLLLRGPSVKPDELPGLLKALGDPSKFDILRILSAETCYAAQLAQRLSLSPATISHHMNVLVNSGLALLSEQENRIYYRSNEGRIRALLRALEQTLLPDAP